MILLSENSTHGGPHVTANIWCYFIILKNKIYLNYFQILNFIFCLKKVQSDLNFVKITNKRSKQDRKIKDALQSGIQYSGS